MEGQGRENPENGRLFATVILDKCKGALTNEKICSMTNSRNTLENRKTRNVLIRNYSLPSQISQGHYDALHRVFRPPPHRLRTLSNGVPLHEAVSQYDCIISCHKWARHAPLPSCKLARCIQGGFSKRQPESATNLDTTWHIGDCIAEENWQ